MHVSTTSRTGSLMETPYAHPPLDGSSFLMLQGWPAWSPHFFMLVLQGVLTLRRRPLLPYATSQRYSRNLRPTVLSGPAGCACSRLPYVFSQGGSCSCSENIRPAGRLLGLALFCSLACTSTQGSCLAPCLALELAGHTHRESDA